MEFESKWISFHSRKYVSNIVCKMSSILPRPQCVKNAQSLVPSQIAKFMGPTWGPTWVLSAPDGLHVGPMNPAIGGKLHQCTNAAA